jgi:hypothetical protein
MKKVTVMLAGGLPMAFLASFEQVGYFREAVRKKLLYTFEDTAIACDHVMAYYVEDAPKDAPEDDEETKEAGEDDCNT